ncbi:MAG TPA: hypothetical protein VNL35_16715 [Chloroflexota bacterium]|nr:hypothetical protein [Chloroflexota bacterium]
MTTAIIPATAAGAPYIGMGGWPRMKDWTTAHRRVAAERGWHDRRNPDLQAWKRFNTLLATADPRRARLYHCDIAESVF